MFESLAEEKKSSNKVASREWRLANQFPSGFSAQNELASTGSLSQYFLFPSLCFSSPSQKRDQFQGVFHARWASPRGSGVPRRTQPHGKALFARIKLGFFFIWYDRSIYRRPLVSVRQFSSQWHVTVVSTVGFENHLSWKKRKKKVKRAIYLFSSNILPGAREDEAGREVQ